jgi:hypothetical protein
LQGVLLGSIRLTFETSHGTIHSHTRHIAINSHSHNDDRGQHWEAQLRKGCLEMARQAGLWQLPQQIYWVDDGIGADLNGWKLPPIAAAERDEIVVESRAPIHDSVSGTSDPNGATERGFRLLGTPEELAHRYTTESLFSRRWLRFLCLALAAHQLATGQGRDHGNDDFLRCIIWLRHSLGTYLRLYS